MGNREVRLEIRSAADGEYEVEATSIGLKSGKARGRFAAPLVGEWLTELRKAVTREIKRRAGKLPAEESGLPIPLGAGPGLEDAAAIGSKLFEALFAGEVRSFFESCVSALESRRDEALRLRLTFDHTDPKVGLLSELPWELLCDPRNGLFFGLYPQRSIVRDFSIANWVHPLQTALPLRVLIVDAGEPQFDAAREIEEIKDALRDPRRFRVRVLDHPDAFELHRFLQKQEIHLVHLICHGGYSREAGIGAVFLRSRNQEKFQVNGTDLAHHLGGLPHLRLVVLSSCLTASFAGRHGVASARAVLPNPPAIVAMQHGISHRSAIDFSRAFYLSLADGTGVDRAVNQARLALASATSEWATPVVFMPSEDGTLFDLSSGSDSRSEVASVVAVAPTRGPEKQHYTLAIHSMVLRDRPDWGEVMREGADDFCELAQYFDGRPIREPSWWRTKVLPGLTQFLLRWGRTGSPLLFDFAAHPSIAYAAGWLLEIKSGLEIGVRQRGGGKVVDWNPGDGSAQPEPVWCEITDRLRNDGEGDVALAISVSNDVCDEVETYLDKASLPVSRLIDARIAPERAFNAVAGADHCLQLARRLSSIASSRSPGERRGTLHLFNSAPNALLFYLGQLSRGFGRVQLYEHPRFGEPDSYAHYEPSLLLPPEDPTDAS